MYQGLSSVEVKERIARGETNELPDRCGRSVAQIVKDNIFTRINAILFTLFIIVLTTGSWINAAFGLLIIANSAIGIVQEIRAKRTLDKLAVIGEAKPRVTRDGKTSEIPREQVVLGDLIQISPGEQIVVDGEIIAAEYLEVDESLLTGEADPIPKAPGMEVLSGSFVVSGTGSYQATKVGAKAYAAQITAEAAKFSLVKSELQAGINSILKVITWVLIPVGLLTIWSQYRLHPQWREAVLAMAGALVPMVPEGLVLLTAMAFALGVIRLGKRECLVQELPAIEGLARVDVVCADKTGTLTENAMEFERLIVLSNKLTEAEITEGLRQMQAADPSPNTSMQAIAKAYPAAETPWHLVNRVPFTSAKKWAAFDFGEAGNWIMGAPDVLGNTEIVAQATELGKDGLRILLLAKGDPNQAEPLAFIVLKQKVRLEAKDTLAYFKEQQVDLKVISGDNAKSVAAIVGPLGIAATEVVDARELPSPDSPEFIEAINAHSIFGRVTPQQKRAMVRALQAKGHTVAMTGDGVNDVLALKDADLGVAMGSGSSATRSVAQIVLLDDNFAILPLVVGEGRRVIGNIERVANLFLTKTIYSAVLALLVLVTQVSFPFQPIHVTITGWFTIGIPAFLLSLPPNNARAQSGFVARVLKLGIPAGIVVACVAFTTYLLTASYTTPKQSATAALAALIVAATWVLSVVARPYELWKIALIALSALMYPIIFFLPITQKLFILDPSNSQAMFVGLIAGIIGAAAIEGIWWWRKLTSP